MNQPLATGARFLAVCFSLLVVFGGMSLQGAEESPVVVDTAAPEPRAQEPAEPTEPAEPAKKAENAENAEKPSETVKQWLEAHPGEKVYAVVLGATMNRNRDLLHLRVSRVTNPRSKNTQSLDVEIPPSFLMKCRTYIEEGPFKPSIDHGLPVEFFTYVYYLPAYPEAVIAKLSQSMAKVTEQPAEDFQPVPHMPQIPSLVSPDRKPVEVPGGI